MNKVQANKTKCTFRDCESRLSQEKCECQRTKMNNNLSFPPFTHHFSSWKTHWGRPCSTRWYIFEQFAPSHSYSFFSDRFTITLLLSRTYFTQEFNYDAKFYILPYYIILQVTVPFCNIRSLNECQPKVLHIFKPGTSN